MIVRSYQDLRVWQIGMSIVEDIYRMTEVFPRKELYALSDQVQRAAVSIPSNIAEGHARDSTREFLHHVSITLGSLAELETQILLAERLEYIDGARVKLMFSKTAELGKMLRSLQKTLKAKL